MSFKNQFKKGHVHFLPMNFIDSFVENDNPLKNIPTGYEIWLSRVYYFIYNHCRTISANFHENFETKLNIQITRIFLLR
jgi:hypothetical protein